MPERTSYVHGTPSWVDLATPDVDAACEFYGELFEWQAETPADPEQAGGYRSFTLRGKHVAGVMPVRDERQPAAWVTHVTVDDVEATAKAVESAGGSVMVAPMDVLTEGRFAVFADPAGAVFATWEPRDHKGAQLINEPGALTWNELATPNAEDSIGFYSNVFGWTHQESLMPGMEHPYYDWKRDDESVAGMMQITEESHPGVPPHWLTYFAVEGIDRTVAKVEQLGGAISLEPQTIELGRFAVLSDPQGAVFAVMQMNQPAD